MSRAATIVRSLVLVLAGAAVAVGAMAVLSHRRAAERAAAPASAPEAKQLWTCSMHPQVIQDHPGTCPICHMDLVPLKASEPAPPPAASAPAPATASSEENAKQLWTCGMHPQVIQDHPGTCPICHMELTPLRVATGSAATTTVAGGRRVMFWRSPMDPMVTSPTPAKDSMGMDFVPVYADEAGTDTGPEVVLEPGLVQRMNVTTARAERRDLVRKIETVGTIELDHEREATVTVKAGGFVENVHVHLVGEAVKRGQALFDLYSPELLQAQRDLISSNAYAKRLRAAGASADSIDGAEALATAARERLRLWDVSPAQIRRIEERGETSRVLTVTSPVSGVITEQMEGLVGREVTPGMSVYSIADVSRVWVTAEIYEDQVGAVREGDAAVVRLDAFPGERFDARVLAVKPWVESQTRTVHVTLALDNPGGRLRQGMYAHVEFAPAVAQSALVVPSQSVLRTGQRNVVVVSKGEGRFAPREVVLGAETGSEVQVLSGLGEGEEIVTSAQFLIDSESSLRAAVQAMISSSPGEGAKSEPR